MNTPEKHIWDKNRPFIATVIQRELLSKPGSNKLTYHLVLDIRGSGITYEVGDSVGIFPINDPDLVEKTLHAMHADPREIVKDKATGHLITLQEFLTKKANLSDVSRKFLNEVAERQPNAHKKALLEELLSETKREELKAYLEHRELWDILRENEEVRFPAEHLCHFLMPLLPRFYSIASSAKVVGEEIHLTVALLHYNSLGHPRKGVCTHFLCHLAPLNTPCIPLFIQKHKGFTIPNQHEQDMIMIGPGTGIAPFRAFMQERRQADAKGRHWLFFGEWTQKHDYYYEEFWKELESLGKLVVHTAFSRDQNEKVYVQHRMLENAPALFAWLEEGAVIYVCGNASHMAKDVDATLLRIIQEQGKLPEAEAKEYLKMLRSQKRYLRDVY